MLIALVLTVVGLHATELPIGFVAELLGQVGFAPTPEQGELALLASPVLLALGSLLPGV